MQSRGIQSRRFLIAVAFILLTSDDANTMPQQKADTLSEDGSGSTSRPEDVDDGDASSLIDQTDLTLEIDEDPLTEVIGRGEANSGQQDHIPVSHTNLALAKATLESPASPNVTDEQEIIGYSSQDCRSAERSPRTILRILAVRARNDSSLVVTWYHSICDVQFSQYNLTVVNASENPLHPENHVVYSRIVDCSKENNRCKHVINKRVTKAGGNFTVHVTVHDPSGKTTGKTVNVSVLIPKPAPDTIKTTAEPKPSKPNRSVPSATDSSEEAEAESSEEETDQETFMVPERVPVSRIAEIHTGATVEHNTSTDQDVLVSDDNISTRITDMPNNDSPIPPSKLQEAPSSLSKDCRSAGESPITMPRNLTMQRSNGSSVITWLHPECEGKFQRYILLLVNGTGKERSPSNAIMYDRTINCTEEQCRHVIKESPSQIEGNYTIYVVGEWPDQKIGKNAAIAVTINSSSSKNTSKTIRKQSPLPNYSKYYTTTPEPQTNMKVKNEPITPAPVRTPNTEKTFAQIEAEIPQTKQITKTIDRNNNPRQAPEAARTESQVAPTSADQKQNLTKFNADVSGQENAVVDGKLPVIVTEFEPDNAAHLEAVTALPDINITPDSEDLIGSSGDASIMDISPRNASASLSAGEYGTPGSSTKDCRKAKMLPITRPQNLTVTRKNGLTTVSWLQPACEGKFPTYAVVVVNGPDENTIPIKNIVFSESAACTEIQCNRVLETDKIQAGGNYTFYVVGQWPDESIGGNINVTVHIPTTAKDNTANGIDAVDHLAPVPANKNASSDGAAAEQKNTLVTTTESSTSADRPPADTEHQSASEDIDTEKLETTSSQTSADIDNTNATEAQENADGPYDPDLNKGNTTNEDKTSGISAKNGAQLATKMTSTNSKATEDQAAILDMPANVSQSQPADDTPNDDEHITAVRPAARTLCNDNNTKAKEIQNLKIKDNVQSVLLSWERPKCEGNFNIYQIVVVNASTVNSTHRVDYHTQSVCKQQYCMHDINSTTCPTCFKQRDNYTFIVTTHSDMIPFIPRTSIRTLIDIEGCDDFLIPPNAVRVCTGGSKTIHTNHTSQVVWRKAAYCQVHCRPGYGFYEVADKYYTCKSGGVWGPSARAPDCLPTTAVYSASLQYKLVYHPPIIHLQDQIPELVRKFSAILCAHQPDNCTTTTIYTELSPKVPDHLMTDLLGGNSSTPRAPTHPNGNTIDVTITVEPQVFNISDQLLFTRQTDLVVASANEDNSFMTLLDYPNLKFILPLVQPGVNAKAKSTLCCQKCPEGYAYRAASCVKCPGETC